MGIDIYLNGYSAFAERTGQEREAFEDAVRLRDSYPRETVEHKAAQELVEAASDKMWAGRKGYLRSSYNGRGTFRVLEEIFGFDIAGYLFPGDWAEDVELDSCGFLAKVEALQKTAVAAMAKGRVKLPWIEEFTEVTGQRAPDPNEARVQAEAFGDSVFGMLASAMGGVDKIEGGPGVTQPALTEDHGWYLTEGLREIREFGELAARIGSNGQPVYAEISY